MHQPQRGIALFILDFNHHIVAPYHNARFSALDWSGQRCRYFYGLLSIVELAGFSTVYETKSLNDDGRRREDVGDTL